MSIHITSAPCCWGVDDVKNPHLPPWQLVLKEAGQAGYKGIELGPYGYLPLDIQAVGAELQNNGLSIVAGTIFDDLVSPANADSLIRQTHDICRLISQLPKLPTEPGQTFAAPYLVVMDWGHEERNYQAGHPDRAPRLSALQWGQMIDHIKAVAAVAWSGYGIRTVIHPHAGGYIEFADEIDKVVEDIPYETAGLCLDTGHLYYSGMNPEAWLRKYADRIDYVHFKDIDLAVYQDVMSQTIKFFDACAKGVMCPIGKGGLDYTGIERALRDIDYHGYITVEQERDPRNAATSLHDVTQSLRFLQSVGFN